MNVTLETMLTLKDCSLIYTEFELGPMNSKMLTGTKMSDSMVQTTKLIYFSWVVNDFEYVSPNRALFKMVDQISTNLVKVRALYQQSPFFRVNHNLHSVSQTLRCRAMRSTTTNSNSGGTHVQSTCTWPPGMGTKGALNKEKLPTLLFFK